MAQEVESLETQFHEKEALISALTERLEQAAEQLDRVHRMGADRGVRKTAGIPVELVEQQKVLTDDLQRAIQQWEEMQLGRSLGRLEMQISELRDLIVGKALDLGGGAALARSSENPPATRAAEPPASAAAKDQKSGLSAWEAMKADILGQEKPATPVAASRNEGPAIDDAVEEPEHVDAPEPIVLDGAQPEQLCQAVEQRDNYISYLLKRLRVLETRHTPQIDWAALESAPEELRTKLQELEAKFEERLRMAEVEHSLERARLGREEARLRTLEDNARRQLKRMGVTLDGEEAPTIGPEQEKTGRWLRMLGLRKGEEGDE
jgi:hypothetical protein